MEAGKCTTEIQENNDFISDMTCDAEKRHLLWTWYGISSQNMSDNNFSEVYCPKFYRPKICVQILSVNSYHENSLQLYFICIRHDKCWLLYQAVDIYRFYASADLPSLGGKVKPIPAN